MERKYVTLGLLLLLLISLFTIPELHAAENHSISQVYVELPQVDVYLNEAVSESQAENAQAYLGERSLSFQSIHKAGEEGVHYILLLDISASVPRRQFGKIKEGIFDFAGELRAEDQLSLYTFGDEVTRIFADSKQVQDLAATVKAIENRDQNTLLFEAMDQAAKQIQAERIKERTVLIVITDGEDFAVGKSTQNETMRTLEEKGIPLYACAVGSAQKEYVNSLGETARTSGGQMVLMKNGESGAALAELKESIENASVISFAAENNVVSRSMEKLVLTFADSGEMFTKDILVTNFKPDEIAPEILSVQRKSETELLIRFSETVLGAENPVGWQVTRDGEKIAVESAEMSGKDAVCLTMGSVLYAGEYQLFSSRVTDDSHEKNSLQGQFSVLMEGESAPEEVNMPETAVTAEKNSWVIWGIIGGASLILSAVIVLIAMRSRKKEKTIVQIPKEREEIFREGEALKVGDPDVHEYVRIERVQGLPVTILVDADGRNVRKIDARLDKSLFIGRNKANNYSFDDPSMSGQHFVLEYDGRTMYVTDLNSSNGTRVNGIEIGQRHVLHPGDVISAGMIRFRIQW